LRFPLNGGTITEVDTLTRSKIQIQLGLPEDGRRQAAALYYEAFRQKLEPIFDSPDHAIATLAPDLSTEMAFVALDEDQVVGVAGLQHSGHHFVNAQVSAFAREFGWLRGLFKFGLFLTFGRRQREGELLMDGIVVHSSQRGQGIGTRLLQAVFDFAQANGFHSVRLDVVDTNPGARRLYERLGFVPTETHEYPYLRRWMGFSASTTMIKEINKSIEEE
jgi:ribosomal protein S18 acetylase RimI-like enzyme